MECEVRAILAEMNKLRMSRMVFAAKSQDLIAHEPKIIWMNNVIELSGVQFGLKSYAWFQNDFSMIADRNCTTRSSIAT